MVVDHWRPRKTGPEHPLMVARCGVHGVAFTVYPPRHFPYGRRPLVRCDPAVRDVPRAEQGWDGTVFEPAAAAARGEPWVRQAVGGSETWWSSQGRRLRFAMLLTGTHPDMAERLRHRVAEALAVPALVLREQASRIRSCPGFSTRGRAVMAVLRRLRGRPYRPLLVVGQLVGLWGRALWWDGVLRPVAAFRTSGTDPPAS